MKSRKISDDNSRFDDVLHNISFFLHHTFYWKYREACQNSLVNEADKEVRVENKFYEKNYFTATGFSIYGQSITSFYVNSIFHFFYTISELKEKDRIRDWVIQFYELFFHQEPEFNNIRKILSQLIWAQIEENVNGFYPLILPAYLALMGRRHNGNDFVKNEYNKLVDLLETKIKPKIISEDKMVNGALVKDTLLPPDIRYNEKTDKFEYLLSNGIEEMKIVD